jgi:hypothetical protein
MNTPIKPTPGHSDPFLEEIQAVKQAVSARAGHDVAKLCHELRLEQEQSTRRIVHRGHGADRKAI